MDLIMSEGPFQVRPEWSGEIRSWWYAGSFDSVNDLELNSARFSYLDMRIF